MCESVKPMKIKDKKYRLNQSKSDSRLYPELHEEMAANDVEKSAAPLDDVDFTSGFETQYEQEYRPLKPKVTVPPVQDSKTLWYRDLQTILMVSLLVAVFLFGTILLTKLVFTTNPLYVFIITAIYVILAIIMVVIEVKSIHVR